MSQSVPAAALPPITIVVPIFRDLRATQACLESLLASNLPVNASIVIIDDCSPEPELSKYCRELTTQAGVTLIVNDENLGFVKTANKGFAQDVTADILLLNSDTIVTGDWLQRIQRCAYSADDTGTVTPFTNNGTICSYPVFLATNELPPGWTVAALDGVFKAANAGIYRSIPTAVGFCMYIKRACLNEIGPFDEANFGRGYGEECDFSMRASAKGWKHVVAADVFVFHEGGASFADESASRKQFADETMGKLHPEYHQRIRDFVQSDTLYELRSNVDEIRLRERPSDRRAVLDEHYGYVRTILARAAEYRQAMLSEREQCKYLERLLNECRQEFARTDRALNEAQKVVDDLKLEIERANIGAANLMEHINNMEQSRSWRYTAWLRRR